MALRMKPNIKLLIFDLDGTLCCTKEIHFKALNYALKSVGFPEIQYSEHVSTFDGLPTKDKLHLLSKKFSISNQEKQRIYDLKQEITNKLLILELKEDENLIKIFQYFQNIYDLSIATNCIRPTAETIVKNLGIHPYIDFLISSSDIKYPKPHPEIYLKTIEQFKLSPTECLIFEDSEYGMKAAEQSKSNVFFVSNPQDITVENIENFIKYTL